MLSLPAYGLIERRLERSFPAGDKAALKVDSFYGRVTVREVPDAKDISVVVIQTADVAAETRRVYAEVGIRPVVVKS